MNRHVNKNKTAKLAPQNRVPLVIDSMPREVATEMLLAPGHQTTRQRKTFMAARAKYFQSTLKPKPAEERMNVILQGSNWGQLHKWLKRSRTSRADVQRGYLLATRNREKLIAEPVDKKNEARLAEVQARIAFLDRLLAELNLKAANIEFFTECVEEEIKRRTDKFVMAVKQIAPETGKALEKALS